MSVKPKPSAGRVVLAVVSGYVANGVLVMATEQLLSWRTVRSGAAQPLYYFLIDLITQCSYTIVGGYVCRAVAGPGQRMAMAMLIAVGVSVGTASLLASWKTEPHWYGIALLAVYPPCVWLGWTAKDRSAENR